MEKYFEINKDGQNIRCKLYFEKNAQINKVVLYGHGFAGHKDNSAAAKFADRILTKYRGIAVVCFNLPCHGDDVRKKLTLSDCLSYIGTVADYIRNSMHVDDIYSYATSFGGYLVLKYISDNGNPFKKIALRCPAVDMAGVMKSSLIGKGQLEMLEKGKNTAVGFDRKIEISPQFLQELEAADITKTDFLDWAEDILIIHGTADEIVPFDDVKGFADNSLIEFIPVQRADHRFQNPACMEAATKAVIAFFGF